MIRFCVRRVTYQANGECVTAFKTFDVRMPVLEEALTEVRKENGEIVEYSKLVWAEVLAADGEPAMWRIAKTPSKRDAARHAP